MLAGVDNGINYIFDETETRLVHGLPYNPLKDPVLYQEAMQCGDGIQFSHTIEEQVGGLLQAGFRLTHLLRTPMVRAICMNTASQLFWRCGLQKRSKFGQTRERHTWRKFCCWKMRKVSIGGLSLH
ncbi:MAG: hypothetical protein ACLUUO_20940 [Sellimonas intestinalis]